MQTRRRAATSFTVSEAEKSGSKGEAKFFEKLASKDTGWIDAPGSSRGFAATCKPLVSPATAPSSIPKLKIAGSNPVSRSNSDSGSLTEMGAAWIDVVPSSHLDRDLPYYRSTSVGMYG